MRRRRYLQGLGAVATAAIAGCTGGEEEYPAGDVNLVVPFDTGGGMDHIARLSKPYWEEYLLGGDHSLVIENVTGGGGTVGTEQAYNANADGYTLLTNDSFQLIPHEIGRDPGFSVQDLSYLGVISQDPIGLTASTETDIADFDDFVDQIGDLTFATQGRGSVGHLHPIVVGELTGQFTEDDLNFIHYEGVGAGLTGMERGEADLAAFTATSGHNVALGYDTIDLLFVWGDAALSDRIHSAQHFASDIDADGIDRIMDVSLFPRFYAGPPDMPEDILETQREAFEQVISDDGFMSDAEEANRVIVDPADHERIEQIVQNQFELMSTEPFKSLIEGMF
ncbi:Bug family tripartite tricarboxylate transporter substrate binding protein [Haloferax sp. DFSO52]|uniref:Bug family tripartite tricarboxylate transporter substrate binding protein n=1 Tax=Haloferax sp. DFSO52 TaxID=3388505 RepID=UPI003A850624